MWKSAGDKISCFISGIIRSFVFSVDMSSIKFCVESVMFSFCFKLAVIGESDFSDTLRSAFEVVGIGAFFVISSVF